MLFPNGKPKLVSRTMRPLAKRIAESSHNAKSDLFAEAKTSLVIEKSLEHSSTAASSSYPDFETAAHGPFAAIMQCRETYKRDHASHNANMYQALVAGMAAALTLERSYDEWKSFVVAANSHKLRRKPIRRDKDNVNCISIAIEIIFEPSHGYTDAKKKGRLVEYLAFRQYTPPQALKLLQSRGFAKLLKKAQNELPLRGLNEAQKAALKAKFKAEGGNFYADLNDDESDDGDERRPAKDMKKIDLFSNLVVHSTGTLITDALATNVGERVTFVVENKGSDDGGYITFELLEVM